MYEGGESRMRIGGRIKRREIKEIWKKDLRSKSTKIK